MFHLRPLRSVAVALAPHLRSSSQPHVGCDWPLSWLDRSDASGAGMIFHHRPLGEFIKGKDSMKKRIIIVVHNH